MIVRAMRFLARFRLLASMNLIVKRMILLFLPAMGVAAPIFVLASINSIILHECFHLPIRALLFVIIVNVRLPTIVLPVVCIDTDISRMCCVTVRTPHGFEVKHIKVCVSFFNLMKEVDC